MPNIAPIAARADIPPTRLRRLNVCIVAKRDILNIDCGAALSSGS